MANGSQYLNRLLQLALRQIGPAHREQAGPSWAYVDPVRWTGSLTSAFPRSSKRAGFNDNIVQATLNWMGVRSGFLVQSKVREAYAKQSPPKR